MATLDSDSLLETDVVIETGYGKARWLQRCELKSWDMIIFVEIGSVGELSSCR